ncbi:MAG: adenylate/guanylate cyclase domain-containing protein [Chloroflexi bacterium]|nr:adenylate/guanylate cyclase domain-containing protein [Chloroflexota bacterium]
MLLIALPRSAPGNNLLVLPRVAGSVMLLTTATVGGLLISRRPANPIGWILSVSALVWGFGAFATEYAIYAVVEQPGVLPGGNVAAWLATWMLMPPGFGFLFVLLLFPEGQLPSPHWKPLAVATIVGMAAWTLSVAFPSGLSDTTIFAAASRPSTPIALIISPVLGGLGLAITLAGALMAVLSLFVRMRRATGSEVQQLKWLLFGAICVVCTTVILTLAIQVFGIPLSSPGGLVFGSVAALSFVAIPVCTGIAILRFRLYDIDLIINRSLVYGSVTALLALAFLAFSALAKTLLQPVLGQQTDLVPVIVAVGVAVTFRGVRRRVQAAVDNVLPAREERALFFTDIVGSTELLAQIGDTRWREQLERYRTNVRSELRRFGGAEMHIAGDSFFAAFTDPVRAVRCARALAPRLRGLGIPSRFGIHWGVCEMRGEEVSGLAVWTAARVMATAGPDEIVVSDAIRERVADAAVPMEERGLHQLKGIPGEWRLHAIVATRVPYA